MAVIGSAIQSQKQGEEDVRVPALDNDDIGQLGEMFNQMLDSILERDRQFRTVVDHLPIAVSLKDIDGGHELTNRKYDQWFGNGSADVNDSSEIANSDKNAMPVRAQQERQVIDSGRPVTWEEQGWVGDGDRRNFVTTLFPVFNNAGVLDATGTASTDITDLKRG